MADTGMQAPDAPAHPAPQAPQQPIQQAQQISHLNWLHLLRTNDWMNTHQFQEGVKIQRFCLTLIGETRLWYECLRTINKDWLGLQNQFRQQYSKIGNMQEQLFHVWRSFHFDENIETVE